jgi:hypothetical protein
VTTLILGVGNDKAKVLPLNLRNRIIFKAADEMGAIDSADFLGQKKVTKRSWGYSNGMMTRNYYDQEEHKIKAYQLRHMKKTRMRPHPLREGVQKIGSTAT